MSGSGNDPPNLEYPSVTTSNVAYRVFGDESMTEGSGPGSYRVQGILLVPEEGMTVVRTELARIRSEYRTGGGHGEIKWSGIRGKRLRPRVAGLLKMFFEGPAAAYLRFDCIVVQHSEDQTYGTCAETRDLGVYKTFFVLLKNRLPSGSSSTIVLDERPGLRVGAEEQLRECLNAAGARSAPPFAVSACLAADSRMEDLIQLTDLLCGAVAWDWNGRPARVKAKHQLHGLICQKLGCTTLRRETYRDPKFGLWRYRPRQAQVA